jgi:hypothetical protein
MLVRELAGQGLLSGNDIADPESATSGHRQEQAETQLVRSLTLGKHHG